MFRVFWDTVYIQTVDSHYKLKLWNIVEIRAKKL